MGRGPERAHVSIPFIAGQWSLPSPPPPHGGARPSFNPLHCGAVVASSMRWRSAARPARRFNPLHCGAVVASGAGLGRRRGGPFLFQSPSLRGSGRFSQLWRWLSPRPPCFNPLHCGAVVASRQSGCPLPGGVRFQSPSLRGSGRFVKPRSAPRRKPTRVSIPFIAGQWSLPEDGAAQGAQCVEFQSPSLRGSGRFVAAAPRMPAAIRGFQSPSLRGSGRFPTPNG